MKKETQTAIQRRTSHERTRNSLTTEELLSDQALDDLVVLQQKTPARQMYAQRKAAHHRKRQMPLNCQYYAVRGLYSTQKTNRDPKRTPKELAERKRKDVNNTSGFFLCWGKGIATNSAYHEVYRHILKTPHSVACASQLRLAHEIQCTSRASWNRHCDSRRVADDLRFRKRYLYDFTCFFVPQRENLDVSQVRLLRCGILPTSSPGVGAFPGFPGRSVPLLASCFFVVDAPNPRIL